MPSATLLELSPAGREKYRWVNRVRGLVLAFIGVSDRRAHHYETKSGLESGNVRPTRQSSWPTHESMIYLDGPSESLLRGALSESIQSNDDRLPLGLRYQVEDQVDCLELRVHNAKT